MFGRGRCHNRRLEWRLRCPSGFRDKSRSDGIRMPWPNRPMWKWSLPECWIRRWCSLAVRSQKTGLRRATKSEKNPHYGKIPIPMWNCGNFVGFRTLAFVVNVQSIVVGFSVKVRRLDQDFGARSLDRPLIIRIVFIVDQLYHSRR